MTKLESSQIGFYVWLGEPEERIGRIVVRDQSKLEFDVIGENTETISQEQKEEALSSIVERITERMLSRADPFTTDWWQDLQGYVNGALRLWYEHNGEEMDRPVILKARIFQIITYWTS